MTTRRRRASPSTASARRGPVSEPSRKLPLQAGVDLDRLCARLRAINAVAPQLRASHSQLPVASILNRRAYAREGPPPLDAEDAPAYSDQRSRGHVFKRAPSFLLPNPLDAAHEPRKASAHPLVEPRCRPLLPRAPGCGWATTAPVVCSPGRRRDSLSAARGCPSDPGVGCARDGAAGGRRRSGMRRVRGGGGGGGGPGGGCAAGGAGPRRAHFARFFPRLAARRPPLRHGDVAARARAAATAPTAGACALAGLRDGCRDAAEMAPRWHGDDTV